MNSIYNGKSKIGVLIGLADAIKVKSHERRSEMQSSTPANHRY